MRLLWSPVASLTMTHQEAGYYMVGVLGPPPHGLTAWIASRYVPDGSAPLMLRRSRTKVDSRGLAWTAMNQSERRNRL